jgi:hypothetical protein
MPTRTSSRQAAQKAKEAITSTSDIKPKKTAGAKRKEPTEKGPEPKRGKKVDREPEHEKEEKEEQQKHEEKDRPEPKEQVKEEAVPGPGEKDEKEEQEKATRRMTTLMEFLTSCQANSDQGSVNSLKSEQRNQNKSPKKAQRKRLPQNLVRKRRPPKVIKSAEILGQR